MSARIGCWCVFIFGVVFLLTNTNRVAWLKQTHPIYCQKKIRVSQDLELENALASLFTRELGYTLIGEKPVSIDVNDDYYLYKHPHSVKKVLRFLQKTFKGSPGFILKINLQKDGYYKIELSNKKSLTKIINEHQKLQAFVKNRFGSVNAFLDQASSSKEGVFDLLHAHASMRGILLGYGRTNTEYFCRRRDIGSYLKKHPFSCVFFPAHKPKPRSIYFRFFGPFKLEQSVYLDPKPKERDGFGSLEDEWEWIREVEWDLSDECLPIPPYYVELPLYICRHGGDSEQIRERYEKASERLASFFCGRSFTKAITEEAKKSALKNLLQNHTQTS